MFYIFIVGTIVFICFVLFVYCLYKLQPFHTENNELKPSMIHSSENNNHLIDYDENNENNEKKENVYKHQNDNEKEFPQTFENNTKSKMQRMQTESSCMDIYLNVHLKQNLVYF